MEYKGGCQRFIKKSPSGTVWPNSSLPPIVTILAVCIAYNNRAGHAIFHSDKQPMFLNYLYLNSNKQYKNNTKNYLSL